MIFSDVFFLKHDRPLRPKKTGRWLAITLRELRKQVELKGNIDHVPSRKKLEEMNAGIVIRQIFTEDVEIIVYKSGYVLYRPGKRLTVYPLPPCKNYFYESVSWKSKIREEMLLTIKNIGFGIYGHHYSGARSD